MKETLHGTAANSGANTVSAASSSSKPAEPDTSNNAKAIETTAPVDNSSEHWAVMREAGTVNGIRFLFWLNRVFGRWLFSAVLLPVMFYFMLRRGEQRRASVDYLRRHFAFAPQGWQGRPGYWQVFKHFRQFGEALLDKLLAWSMDMSEDNFEVINRPFMESMLDDPRGQVLIGSHFGNMEFCRGFMQRYKDRPINALVYDQHASNFADIMEQVHPGSRINLYQVDQLSIPVILELKAKVEQGEWLVIAGDRVPVSGDVRTVTVNFLGAAAQFPIGPYILAHALQCPVTTMFAYRRGARIRVEFRRMAEQLHIPRKNRAEVLQQSAQHFADELQEHCLQSPLQWFNFYDFWANKRA